MREIKFRGLNVDRSGFVKGNYMHTVYKITDDKLQIYPPLYNVPPVNVIPDTIGQFTGLKDINGIEIYEGDILEYHHNTYVSKNWEVIFYSGAFFMAGLPNKIRIYNIGQKLEDVKVIGNIHEHPHLLTQHKN